MLARANSDAGTRLRRSKSASTVHKRPTSIAEPLDLDAIKQQALAAATAAFARAQAQNAADRNAKRSVELARSKSNASRKSLTSQGSHFPPRDSSFRSLQRPTAEQTRSAQRLSQASADSMEQNTEQFPPFYPTPSVHGSLSIPRYLSTQPSITFSENARPSSQPKSFRQSASSSITSQQIRKARSMYYASSVQTGSPIARPPSKYLTTPPVASISPVSEPSPIPLPSRTIRPSPLAGPRMPVTVGPDTTLDKVRDEYLQDFQQKAVKHKPSMFLAPFKKRQDKGNDKGKRVASEAQSFSTNYQQTPDESTVDLALSDFVPPQGIKEKRSFSGSLKSKIKKVFRRTSGKSTILPVQQIDASRDYFHTAHYSPPTAKEGLSIPPPNEETLKRIRARTPSLEGAYPAFLRSGSRSNSTGSARSNRSLHSEANAANISASRVTSWGTTTTSDTLTQRAMKRMTVIHESKDSIGSEADRAASTSASRRKSLPLPPLAAFRDPMPMEILTEESLTPVDPKRVFSALMKEIGSSKSQKSSSPAKRTPGAESDVFESKHEDTTVVLRGSLDISTPRPHADDTNETTESTVTRAGDLKRRDDDGARAATSDAEKSSSHIGTRDSNHTPVRQIVDTEKLIKYSQPESRSLSNRQHLLSTPEGHASRSRQAFERPELPSRNDRFSFLDTGRRSGSNVLESATETHAPGKSQSSPKSTPDPKATTNTSAPATNETTQRVPITTLKRSPARKENITPPSLRSHKSSTISPLGLSTRPNSQQLLCTPRRNSPSTNVHTLETPSAKKNTSSAEIVTPLRPRIRATLRPMSPEKLARRPRSAFDLRGTNNTGRPAVIDMDNYSPLPGSELRRPALTLKTSTSSLAMSKEPYPETRVSVGRGIESVLGGESPGNGGRDGNVTPGQRMADKFLRQRKSENALSPGGSAGKQSLRGGLVLVREDTPAFL
ncbi:hypothetical protein J4E86_006852 [Alternaria arbusti]|uniref:uncharacterized protein n=1 Tax=Alternaria arbusti TaxID=232088 RepID=UPI00221EE41D|nr:uncharacterized protein J4E86_006852 [Alternaria arbusti]KAI4953311.1 hypothetical protein J4E86_006852 [Alternaria arbusti]